MGRGLKIVGVILIVIGILIAGWGAYANYQPSSITTSAGSYASITPSGVGPFVSTVRWSGAASGTTFYVLTDKPTCIGPRSGVVATGNGTGGSVSLTLNAGTTYYLVACSGLAAGAATISVSLVGLGTLLLIGVIILVLGIILYAVGNRKPKSASPMTAYSASK